jgi:hypothetical protein
MAKLIGTGKDPRFPKGQDYDVPEQDLQHHVDAHLGEPVEPGNEAYAVHRGYDTIAVDASEPPGIGGEESTVYGRPPTQGELGTSSRAAARVETTAGPGKEAQSAEAVVGQKQKEAERVGEGSGQADQGSDPEGSGSSDSDGDSGGLSKLSREELNERAEKAGVEDPKSLSNKDEVIAAIRKAEG